MERIVGLEAIPIAATLAAITAGECAAPAGKRAQKPSKSLPEPGQRPETAAWEGGPVGLPGTVEKWTRGSGRPTPRDPAASRRRRGGLRLGHAPRFMGEGWNCPLFGRSPDVALWTKDPEQQDFTATAWNVVPKDKTKTNRGLCAF